MYYIGTFDVIHSHKVMGHLILKHEMVKKNVIALLHYSKLQIDWLTRY